jgi:hypothetical protein
MSDREVHLTESPDARTGDYQRESTRVSETPEEKRAGKDRDPCEPSERNAASEPEREERRGGNSYRLNHRDPLLGDSEGTQGRIRKPSVACPRLGTAQRNIV